MEEQLLPREELAPAYEKAVWLYVYRDFSEDERDRADERICLRFGFSSYPQHKLVHPETLEIVGDTGRKVEGFLAAIDRARVKVSKTTTAASRLVAAEERARKLETSPTPALAERALEDDDVVVRLRGLGFLEKEKPGIIVRRAEELLAIPNDPLRYAVCRALAKEGDTSVARALDALVEKPEGSLNPNVLRMNAVMALARCGDHRSVEALAPHADGNAYRNSLTRSVITTLGSIAAREKAARKRVAEVLAGAFPDPQTDEREQTMAVALAKEVHRALGDVTGRKVKFPREYDADGVEMLRRAWK